LDGGSLPRGIEAIEGLGAAYSLARRPVESSDDALAVLADIFEFHFIRPEPAHIWTSSKDRLVRHALVKIFPVPQKAGRRGTHAIRIARAVFFARY